MAACPGVHAMSRPPSPMSNVPVSSNARRSSSDDLNARAITAPWIGSEPMGGELHAGGLVSRVSTRQTGPLPARRSDSSGSWKSHSSSIPNNEYLNTLNRSEGGETARRRQWRPPRCGVRATFRRVLSNTMIAESEVVCRRSTALQPGDLSVCAGPRQHVSMEYQRGVTTGARQRKVASLLAGYRPTRGQTLTCRLLTISRTLTGRRSGRSDRNQREVGRPLERR